eukprot:364523-Chlamydomonas_euryale.AAC.9
MSHAQRLLASARVACAITTCTHPSWMRNRHMHALVPHVQSPHAYACATCAIATCMRSGRMRHGHMHAVKLDQPGWATVACMR